MYQIRKTFLVNRFVCSSLIIHAAIFLSLHLTRKPERNPMIQLVEISYAKPPPRHVPRPPPPAPPPALVQQVVQQSEQVNKEKDKDTKFLSAFDQKIAKQMQAENGKFNNERSKGEKMKVVEAPKEETPKNEAGREKGEKSLPDLGAQFSPAVAKAGEGGKKDGEMMKTDDYLKDVQKGMQTLLSTRAFAYYNYYTGIKEKISHSWEPSVREKVQIIYREGRSVAAAAEHVTQLLIVIDRDGNLVRVDILKSSGVSDFDDTAVQSFRTAAPFAKPPGGMVETDGTIKIRYDFVVQS